MDSQELNGGASHERGLLTAQVRTLLGRSGNFPQDVIAGLSTQSPLFRDGLAMDSIDLLEFVVNLEKSFGLRIKNDDAGHQALRSIDTVVDAILALPTSTLSAASGLPVGPSSTAAP